MAMDREARLPEGWKEGHKLGEGAYAEVYRCQDAKGRNLPYAAKKIDKRDRQSLEDARTEIDILRNLSHEHIIRYYQRVSHDHSLSIIMEYMPGGSLTDQVYRSGPMTEARTRRYTRQILEGLNYLHSKEIIHRDLKGSNVLLDLSDNIKLTDFGLSKVLYPEERVSGALVEQVGTAYYMSPEMISEKGYGRKTDVWSLGCTIVEMLSGHPPWYEMRFIDLIRMVSAKDGPVYQLPETTSDTAKHFLSICFRWNKNRRPYTDELLKHNFVKEEEGPKRLCCIT